MLEDNNREIRLLNLAHIRHPLISEVIGQNVGFQIFTIFLQSKTFRGFAVFGLAVEIIQNIWGVCKTHVGSLVTHKFKHLGLNTRVTAHKARTVTQFVDVALFNRNLFDVKFFQLLFKVKLLRRILNLED